VKKDTMGIMLPNFAVFDCSWLVSVISKGVIKPTTGKKTGRKKI
jgi:hypothetical protein